MTNSFQPTILHKFHFHLGRIDAQTRLDVKYLRYQYITKRNIFRGNIRSRDSGDGASFETIDQVHINNIRKDSESDRR